MHGFPDLDYSALRDLAKRILQNPDFIKDAAEVKDWQLHDLLTFATREKWTVIDILDRSLWRSDNAEARNYKPESVPAFQMAEDLEFLVKKEMRNRGLLTAAPEEQPALEEQRHKGKQAKKQPEVLPELSNVVKDAEVFLPKLWKALAGMNPPVCTPGGGFFWHGTRGKDAVLRALADALEYRGKLAAGIDGGKAYLVLCTHFGHKPAGRPDKLKKGKRFYEKYFGDFGKEVLLIR